MYRYLLILIFCISVNSYGSDVENAELYTNDWLAQEKSKEEGKTQQEPDESNETPDDD